MEVCRKQQEMVSTRDLYFLPNVRSSFKRKPPRPAGDLDSTPHNHTSIEYILARKARQTRGFVTSPDQHSLDRLALNRTEVVDIYNKYSNLPAVVETIDRKHKKQAEKSLLRIGKQKKPLPARDKKKCNQNIRLQPSQSSHLCQDMKNRFKARLVQQIDDMDFKLCLSSSSKTVVQPRASVTETQPEQGSEKLKFKRLKEKQSRILERQNSIPNFLLKLVRKGREA